MVSEQYPFESPADLHMHSVRSDGTQTPAELVADAYEHGVRTFALTDHDTTAGWAEAAAAAQRHGMTFIPGMELSTKYGYRSIHMLAYLFDPSHPDLLAEMERIRSDRVGRAARIVANIAHDYDLSWEDVLAERSDDASIGRPHIADAMIRRGLVHSREEAFSGILHPRAGYTEPLYSPDPGRAVELIVAAGGVPIMAHPASGRGDMLPLPVMQELIARGLGGFEIEHRENSEPGKAVLRTLVREYDLITTGSSDSHGAGKPNKPGENTTTAENVARILAQGSGSAAQFA